MEANRDHLRLILSGVEPWNAWRRENPYIVAPDLEDADLRGRDLRGANLSKVNLCAVRLEDARLDDASFIAANLSGTKLTRASVRRANFANAHLQGTDMAFADLTQSMLAGVLFLGVDLQNASLEGADLTRAVFFRSRLSGARFSDARIATGFADVDISDVLGLDAVKHVGPSSFGVDTLYKSSGRPPKTFLRDAGVPETFLGYAESLTASPIEFQSCFISYSTVDEAFAATLYSDLRASGIRCWFAPEDLKIGARFRDEIDRSIHLHDRLLVILSAASLASRWVEDEVEAALERERNTGRTVLFPVRIDNAVMTTDTAWAASLRRTRHIGDFSAWPERDFYLRGRERLLRDLRLGTPPPPASDPMGSGSGAAFRS